MTTYISKQTTENKVVRNTVSAPVYACWNALVNATTIDEMKGILRNSKPVNAEATESIGIMKTAPTAIAGFTPVEQTVNAVTFAINEVYVTMNCRVIGADARTVFLQMESGEIRRAVKSSTYFIATE